MTETLEKPASQDTDDEPERLATPRERLDAMPQSRQRAIVAMCWRCMGEAPGWRNEVRSCTDTECPLHGFRPGRTR
jgi:hypothetical protein